MALTGLGKEATAKGSEQLQHILREYQDILEENPANIVGSNILTDDPKC
jgi:hypothetical protein